MAIGGAGEGSGGRVAVEGVGGGRGGGQGGSGGSGRRQAPDQADGKTAKPDGL
ncbi:MAG: hypothetical protein OXI27_05740 [Thaumarchaeota archaeon]|nr:hypothetical protein [Nitrososphaerota archaeon]